MKIKNGFLLKVPIMRVLINGLSEKDLNFLTSWITLYIILSRKSLVTFRVRFFSKIQIRILIRQRIFHFFTEI